MLTGFHETLKKITLPTSVLDLLPIIYSRSLLYLVSGILEPQEVDMPLAGMMRFETCSNPFSSPMLISVHDFLFAAVPQRTGLSRTMVTDPSAAVGLRSNAARHQDFNTDADTQDSLVARSDQPSRSKSTSAELCGAIWMLSCGSQRLLQLLHGIGNANKSAEMGTEQRLPPK